MAKPDARARKARVKAARNADAPRLPLGQRLWRGVMQLVVILGGVAVVAGAARGGLYLIELPVDRIELSGPGEQVGEDAITAVVSPYLSDGFLGANLTAMRTDLQALPWVYRADVRRRWPDTVLIRIDEQRPIARWGSDGFLNHEGERFLGGSDAVSVAGWDDLPTLTGPDNTEADMMRRYQNLEALLTPTGLQVQWLAQDAIGQVSAELDNGTVLALGSKDYVKRVRRFIALHHQQLQQEPVARVDLRYEFGAAVTPRVPGFASTTTMDEG